MYPAASSGKPTPALGLSEIQIPWVESPDFPTVLKRARLPTEMQRLAGQFAQDGFVVFDPEIDDFDTLAGEVTRGLESEYRQSARVVNAWQYNTAVRRLASAPKVLKVLQTLYGREPLPFQTLNFPVGTEQLTHSDTIHFHSIPGRFMCGVWIALEDTDADNGPLHYYPGSQKLPIITLEDLGIDKAIADPAQRYQVYEQFVAQFIRASKLPRQELYIKKGQALIWAANLFHGGSPIKDRQRSRHSQVTHYFFSDCQYYAPLQSTIFKGEIQFIHFRDIKNGQRVHQMKSPWINTFRLTSRHTFRRLFGRA